ncbi:MAG: high-potential iron-sulfur protein [Gammaproteobacteria bacterium]|nr:high-potential iron-sulfur protein [Gammaproteobacteria bacterium]
MKNENEVLKRRQFLKTVGGTALIVPFAGLAACSGDKEAAPAAKPAAAAPKPKAEAPEPVKAAPAPSAEAARLSEDDTQAKAFSYVHDATTLDSSQPRYQAGQVCSNCALYQGAADDEWGPCSIFPGKQVKGTGWCNVYAPKAS